MKKTYSFIPIISIAVLFILWYILSLSIGSEYLFPSPSVVLSDMGEYVLSSEFLPSLFGTFLRVTISFLIALVLSFLLAICAYKSIIVQKMLSPFILLVRSMPTMSLVFLCLIWLGSVLSPVFVSLAVLLPLLYSAFFGALFGVDGKLIEMAKVYGFSKKDIIKDLYLPNIAKNALPEIVGALSFNVKLIIAGEAWAQTAKSLGRTMYRANMNLDTARVFSATIVALVLSFVLELIVFAIKKIYGKIRYAKVNQNK